MTYDEVLENARKLMAPHCKVCPQCDGVACKGKVPGIGARGSGRGFIESVKFLNSVKINMDCIYENIGQDTSIELFKQRFDMPVFIAPIGGMAPSYGGNMTEADYAKAIVKGAVNSGILAFTGDGADDIEYTAPLKYICEVKGMAIPTMKPWDKEKSIDRIKKAEEVNGIAVAMDIDSLSIPVFVRDGGRGASKSVKELKEIIGSTKTPFILKGIMTAKGALKAVEAGAYGIVISNHGGRFIEDTPATFEVIEEIKEAVGDSIKIFVDGGVRTGEDIFKCLALGADAVLIGRTYSIVAFGGGEEGVRIYTEKLKRELKNVMILTGCSSLKDITRDKIRVKQNSHGFAMGTINF